MLDNAYKDYKAENFTLKYDCERIIQSAKPDLIGTYSWCKSKELNG